MIKRGILIPLWYEMFFLIGLYSLFIVKSDTNAFSQKYTQYSNTLSIFSPDPYLKPLRKKQGKCFTIYKLARMFTKEL